jgi:hypothetical protein
LQTRIFVRADEPQTDWAETLIGRVIRPLTNEFQGVLEWFWFSRYQTRRDTDDCDFEAIPVAYVDDVHRSLRFRFKIPDDRRPEFEQTGRQLIAQHGYWISDFIEYRSVADTGSSRFLGVENRGDGRSEQRSLIVNNLYCAISRLVIDALVGADSLGRYRLEENDSPDNPQRSSFQSVLHMFCNITNVPTEVEVFLKDGTIRCATYIMKRPAEPNGGWDQVRSFPLMY